MARWDNIKILQAVDKHQERAGGGAVWGLNGCQLMDELAGTQILDDKLVRGFLRELEILAAEGYLTFRAYDPSENTRRSWPTIILSRSATSP
jgi:hypothetical protein